MNYQVITDSDELLKFIDFLPFTGIDEMFYCTLLARSKYTRHMEGGGIPHLKSDKIQLKRFTATRDRLYRKITQLECPLGCYVQGNREEIVVPQEALALYITVNPRSLKKALKASLKQFAEFVCSEASGINPHSEAMSQIQKSKAATLYVTADVDSKDPACLKQVTDILEPGSYRVMETRGGFHVFIEPSVQRDRKWHPKVASLDFVDTIGDMMSPVPGTYQGGFTPRMII